MDIVVINDATLDQVVLRKIDDMNIIIKTGATHCRSSNMADDVFSDEPSDAYKNVEYESRKQHIRQRPFNKKEKAYRHCHYQYTDYKIQYIFKYFFDMLVYKVGHNRNEYNTADNQSVVYADKCTNSKTYSVNNHIL